MRYKFGPKRYQREKREPFPLNNERSVDNIILLLVVRNNKPLSDCFNYKTSEMFKFYYKRGFAQKHSRNYLVK